MLSYASGDMPDPAVYVTAVPNWQGDEELTLSSGERLRIAAIATDVPDDLLDFGISALWAVEPVEECRRALFEEWARAVKKLRCYLGLHRWQRLRSDGGPWYNNCRDCGK